MLLVSARALPQTAKAASLTSDLLVADGSCPKIRQLLSQADVPVLWLDGEREPLQAISDALAHRRKKGLPVQTLHWVSHGQPGVLQVGQNRVDRAALLAASDQLSHWQVDQLALWACEYGADSITLSLWEELVGASVFSSSSILGVNSQGRKNWTLSSKKHSKTIDWPLNFGDSSNWKHQLATVSYATFSEGPQASDPLTSNEQITAVGYAPSLFGTNTLVQLTFDRISNLNYTTYTDDYSFLDSAITADLVYITFPQTAPSTSQLDNLKQFVEGGGTLLINGEYSPAFDTQNGIVSQILNHIGSSIAVKQGIGWLLDTTLNATPPVGSTDMIEIGNFDITSGLEIVRTDAFGALEIDNESAEAILVTSVNDVNNINMAREDIGDGNAIVFADINMFQTDNSDLFSNIIIQSKLNIQVSANVAPVLTTPTSGSITETAGSSDTTTSGLTGTLSASDADGDTLTYGITGGTVANGESTLAGTYGSLVVNTTTGAYTYTPNSSAVDALDSGDTPTDSFSVTATDGIETTTATYTLNLTGANDSAVITIDDATSQLSVASNGGIQTPIAQIVATTEVTDSNSLNKLTDLEIALSNKAVDFEVELDDDTSTATANIPLAVLLDDLTLTSEDGQRDRSIAPIYYGINNQGLLIPLSYDPLEKAGARFYDTNNDGIADFLSLKLIDGGFGDKDGLKNGKIVDPSSLGTVSLDPVLTALDNGFLQVADAANAAPAAVALQASLTSRANAVTEIGYVILNEGEEASTVSDITAFQERANRLFSALENNDVTLAEAMTFNSQFLLRNGQSIRFFAVTNGTLADLTSLDDSRFSFLDGSVDATTGAASFSSASGIGFDLALLNSDQNLGALIAQEQHAAPLLDFTAFTNDETITGTIVQAREAEYDAVTGFYRVLDTSGSVRAADGSLLTPGDAGYAAAALLEANRISALGDLSIADGESSSTEFSLQDASYIAPFAQVEGNTFFAFADANADGLSHFRSIGTNLFGLEDQLGGGDFDYDDHVFGFNIAGLTPATTAVT